MNVEIERKYIIKLPDLDALRKMPGYKFYDITQIYMPTVDGVSHRIRKIVFGGEVKYTETKKLRIDAMSVYEDERDITEEEFLHLSDSRDRCLNVINKRRHVFDYLGQKFEIDVYPEWVRSCILETELECREAFAKMPNFICVIKEVTGEREYSNHSMAKAFPREAL